MGIRFRWLGYVCFEFVLPSGKVLVVDPYIDYSPTAPIKCAEVTGADYIAITHGHYDHVTDTGTLMRKFHSKILCSREIAEPMSRAFGIDLGDLIRVSAGDTVVFPDLRVEVKRGQHINLIPPMRQVYTRVIGKEPGPGMSLQEIQSALQPALRRLQKPETGAMLERLDKEGVTGGEQLNYLFQPGGNLRFLFYSSGAEDHLMPVVSEAKPNVIFVQLGATDMDRMAEIVALSGADIVIPTHHDGGGIESTHLLASRFARLLAGKTKAQFIDIYHGKWYEIGLTCNEIK
jgi:L-ascorbate metabolism protein UlaG (beta-lactamase superfamily)